MAQRLAAEADANLQRLRANTDIMIQEVRLPHFIRSSVAQIACEKAESEMMTSITDAEDLAQGTMVMLSTVHII